MNDFVVFSNRDRLRCFIVVISLLLSSPSVLLAQAAPHSPTEEIVGTVISVQGTAFLATRSGMEPFKLIRGTRLYVLNQIKTEKNTKVRILLGQKSILDIGSSTAITLQGSSAKQEGPAVNLKLGRIWAKVIKALTPTPNFRIITQHAVVGIRGTEFFVDYDKSDKTQVTVVDGAVELSGKNFPVTKRLEAGFQGTLGALGDIKVAIVPINAVSNLRDTVKPTPQLSGDSRDQLKQMVIDTPLFSPPGPESSIEQEQKQLIPPIEPEPGAGKSKIRIITELRE